MGGYLFYQRSTRLKTDTLYARRLHAPKKAKKGLLEAKGFLAKHQHREFYDAVFKTFQQYVSDKIHLPIGAANKEDVQLRLQSLSIDEKIIQAIGLLFEECEMVRYASFQINEQMMKASYERLETIIDHLERHIK